MLAVWGTFGRILVSSLAHFGFVLGRIGPVLRKLGVDLVVLGGDARREKTNLEQSGAVLGTT